MDELLAKPIAKDVLEKLIKKRTLFKIENDRKNLTIVPSYDNHLVEVDDSEAI
jgi:hypothetical protein